MFQKTIDFFLENEKFNYALFFFIVIIGVYTYITLPKEKFPIMDLDRITISGGYSKISNTLLDKIAVSEIEREIRGIEGIDKVSSTISNGSFAISVELKSGTDKSKVADKLRDAVSLSSKNLPSDMNLPTVSEVARISEVIQIAMTSSDINFALRNVDRVRDKLLAIDGVANVSTKGEREEFITFKIDEKRLDIFGISIAQVVSAIQNLSHIYPLGKIESKGYHLYLLSEGGQKSPEKYLNSIIKVGDFSVRLGDLATLETGFEEDSQLSTVNLNQAIVFEVNKFESENALKVAERVKNFVANWNDPEIELYHFLDDSRSIRDRLNSVVSNILFGLILVFFSIFVLISKRMALVVTIGVPTSFFIAFIFLYLYGYSLNLISLLGLLIALGVLVDDAIIVSENIQRHLENGDSPMEASRKGALEVVTPVTLATLTTIFTFIPLLMLSGQTGNFIMMIPITVSILVIASYFESFLFLPLHAKHILKRGEKVQDWKWLKSIYKTVLKFHVERKWLFLTAFLILIPVSIFYSAKMTKFQFFPRIDTPVIYISGKVAENVTLAETEKIAKEISEEVWRNKEHFGIANISAISGFRRTAVGERENGENLFYIYLDLHEVVPQNIIEKYVTPYLSFDYDEKLKIREMQNDAILKELKQEFQNVKEKYKLEDFSVFKKRIGVKVDIEIGVIADSTQDIFLAISTLENEISEIGGITSHSNNAFLGVDEVILEINPYGQELGITEKDISNALSSLYLSNRRATAIGEKDVLEIVIESVGIDNIDSLSTLNLTLSSGEKVRLTDVANFKLQRNLERINKYDFHQMKSVFVNVDTKVITADEVLQKLEPTFQKLRQNGIEFDFLGEKERKDQLKSDLGKATILALSLIFLSLILAFKSVGSTLLIMSVIPFSLLGVFLGHFAMGMNLTMPGIIGAFGLAGVVINDSIVMLSFLQKAKNYEGILERASQRLRPILLTSITTLLGLSTLIFFVSGQALILQPIAISLGFGLFWGTILNLIYLPIMFSIGKRK
ncbi:cation/multidrug efflux pump [Thiovulum sp. ES]|nr:cation/multidrug efflux pump [Thiovulum sp. ES]